MLRKLLRYDFKAVLKYWWIAALSSVALAFAGGWCISVFANEKDLPDVLYVVATLLMIIVVLGLVAFAILSTILIFSRFYKNFFTDEGYLTFTLPVKRSQLLNSKLIVSTTTTILTALVIIIDILVMVCVGFYKDIFTDDFLNSFVNDFAKEFLRDDYLGYYALWLIEAIVIVMLLVVFSILFMFSCITVASIIAKKAKVITAIGIYYAANSVFSFIIQMFWLFGINSIDSWLWNLSEQNTVKVVSLILFGLILFMSIFCGVLYSLQYWMLDRKLNLS